MDVNRTSRALHALNISYQYTTTCLACQMAFSPLEVKSGGIGVSDTGTQRLRKN